MYLQREHLLNRADLDIRQMNTNGFRERIVGINSTHPLLDGRLVRYINLDNAASTPPLREVLEAIEQFLPYYSSVHRGTGFKSRLSTAAYDEAHEIIGRFVGADPDTNTVIFGKNSTEAINKLAFRYPLPPGSVILSTMMEHHSNDLPWRNRAEVVRAQVTSEGRLDEDDVDRLLSKYGNRIALVSVSGASNVTGFIQPIHRLARKAHAVGARILVDAAQLASHRPIDIRPDDDPEHIDFIALSAHKMYAPFGTGALVGCRDIFKDAPEYQGGGTVELVTPDDVRWAGLPDREEAGSPNVVGAVAMAVAAQALMDTGLEVVEKHEAHLTAYAPASNLPGIRIPARRTPPVKDRVGVISFNMASDHHTCCGGSGYEGGIGGGAAARSSTLQRCCSSEDEQVRWRRELRQRQTEARIGDQL
jgi:selenocysteine lyase/cysteine desulfurase